MTAKRRSEILIEQELYIQTREPVHIEKLYTALLKLGVHILAKGGKLRYRRFDDVRDLAADICMRLMERGEPVIRSAPSAYLQRALLYKFLAGENSELVTLDEAEGFEIHEKDHGDYGEYVDALVDRAGLDLASDVGALVAQTLDSRMDWHKVWHRIPDENARREYRKLMKEVETCARGFARPQAAAEQ